MNRKKAIVLSIIYCVLLIAYSLMEMKALGSEIAVSSWLAITKSIVILIAFYEFYFIGGNSVKTKFTKYWNAWIIWLVIDFLFLFRSGTGVSFIHSFFTPFCFLLTFVLAVFCEKSEKWIIMGFTILFLITGFQTIQLSILYGGLALDEASKFASNLVFWPLCAFVFTSLLKRKIYSFALFAVMIIITLLTAKRSATIIISIEILIYIIYNFRSIKRKNGVLNIMIFTSIAMAVVYIINSRFDSFVQNITRRFSVMADSEGSGRLPIYRTTIQQIGDFNLFELLFGKGYGSIVHIGNTNAHNDALQVLYEYGFVGLTFYLYMIILLLQRLKYVKCYAEQYYIGYVFCIITIFVLGMVSNLTVFNSYFAFICTYIALTEAAIYRKQNCFYESYSNI